MIISIKVGNKTYSLDSKEIEQEKQFRKNKEIEFIRNTRKFWNNLYNHNTNDMKPTEKQIKVIDTILSIIKTWKSTNDISSPTHSLDMHDFLYDLECENIIRSSITDKLEDSLRNLFYTIRIV